eukprot:4867230-Pyramimonas_sp.AAC.2
MAWRSPCSTPPFRVCALVEPRSPTAPRESSRTTAVGALAPPTRARNPSGGSRNQGSKQSV